VLASLRGANLRLLGFTAHEGPQGEEVPPVWEADLTAPRLALVFGREKDGIPEEAEAMLDERTTIPMTVPGDEGSLNVSHAAALAIYERRRQLSFSHPGQLTLPAEPQRIQSSSKPNGLRSWWQRFLRRQTQSEHMPYMHQGASTVYQNIQIMYEICSIDAWLGSELKKPDLVPGYVCHTMIQRLRSKEGLTASCYSGLDGLQDMWFSCNAPQEEGGDQLDTASQAVDQEQFSVRIEGIILDDESQGEGNPDLLAVQPLPGEPQIVEVRLNDIVWLLGQEANVDDASECRSVIARAPRPVLHLLRLKDLAGVDDEGRSTVYERNERQVREAPVKPPKPPFPIHAQISKIDLKPYSYMTGGSGRSGRDAPPLCLMHQPTELNGI
ncbi:unnamed protein product, partial [Polarella glacialis]